MRTTLYILSMGLSVLPVAVAAQHGEPGGAARHPQQMHLIQNEAREVHRRQSAICMNAYPENHKEYTRCVRAGNVESLRASAPQRRYYMPMPAAYRE